MILKWGSYTHEQNEVGIRIHQRSIFDTFGRRMGEVIDWHILGAKLGSSQANITTQLDTLETAYATDYGDLTLYLDDGTTPTKHSLTNSSTFGGTHVTGFGYIDGPWKMRTEYANRRTFWAMIRGERRVGSGQYAWKERIRIKGTGGPKFRYMPRLVGAPIPQVVQTLTTFYYIQEGSAVGRQAHIAPPGPLYPLIEHHDEREIAYYSPDEMRYGGANEKYLTTWRYVMEATVDQGFSAFTLPSV